jgi:pyruvate dehydrogenase E2 component (dihydrolipoamide acetyltransferase)
MSHETSLFEFRFPDIGEGLTEGTIVELKVAPGTAVKQGQTLAIVETDKVVTEMPSPVEGVVVELPIAKGQVVQVGEIVAKIRTVMHPAPTVEGSPDGGSVVGQLSVGSHGVLPASTEGVSVRRQAARNGAAMPTAGRKVRASPVARKLAADAGIDLSRVNGTGPGGRILKKDLEAREALAPTPQPDIPGASSGMRKLSTLRLAIARAMEKSQAIPAAAVHDFTVVDELLQLRRDMNEAAREKVGLLAFFVKAAALALRDFPLMSSIYSPERREYESFPVPHIGVAVDTEEGLVVPVVRDPARLSVPRIHAEIARLTGKARLRTLALEEIRGGSFTISNFGSFSGVYGNPMILPPQVGILGIGRVHEEPVVREGAVVPAWLLPLSLVVDHRLIDGVYACKFLARFMELVSKPLGLLMF